MRIGVKLKSLMRREGLTVDDVAEACGVSASTVARWLAGTGYPKLDQAVALVGVLKSDLNALVGMGPDGLSAEQKAIIAYVNVLGYEEVQNRILQAPFKPNAGTTYYPPNDGNSARGNRD